MDHPRHSATFHPSHRSPATLSAVALGGALGTLSRYALDRTFPMPTGHFPATTLAINLSGSFLIGLLLPFALARAERRPLLRPFLVTGVLGGWTTYSALANDSASLVKTGHSMFALGDVGATLAGGLGLVVIGYWLSTTMLLPSGEHDHMGGDTGGSR
jgi:fluoride exporter